MSNPQYPPATGGGGNGTLILVLGILSIVCLPILGPVAWVMGNNALPMADPSQRGQINAGRICGIVGTVFLILGIIYWLVMFVFVGTHRSQFTTTPPTTPFLWL